MLGWGCGEGERQRLAGLLPILLRHDAGLMLLLFEMAGAAAGGRGGRAGRRTHPGLAARYQREGGQRGGASRPPRPCPPTCRPQTPRHRDPSAPLLAEQGGGEGGGVQEGRSPPLPAPPTTTQPAFSPVICALGEAQPGSWKRCLLPRTGWDQGLRQPLPCRGAQSVWATLSGNRYVAGSPALFPSVSILGHTTSQGERFWW